MSKQQKDDVKFLTAKTKLFAFSVCFNFFFKKTKNYLHANHWNKRGHSSKDNNMLSQQFAQNQIQTDTVNCLKHVYQYNEFRNYKVGNNNAIFSFKKLDVHSKKAIKFTQSSFP